MIWILLALLSGFFDAIVYSLLKRAKAMRAPVVAFVQYLFAVPFMLPFLFIFYPETINPNVYYVILFNGFVLLFIALLLFRAFSSANLSLTLPLLSFTPLFLLITSPILVNESPASAVGYVGVLLIVIGAYILNLKEKKTGWFGPFQALFTRVGPRCAMGAAFLMSIMANVFKIGIEMSNVFFFTTAVHIIIPILILPYILYKKISIIKEIKKAPVTSVGIGFSDAVMSITAGLSLLTAIVPYMISLKRSSILFGLGISKYFFKENTKIDHIAGAIIMLIGGILILVS